MKIMVDLVSVRREWDPKTHEHVDFLVVELVGRTFLFQVTEEEAQEVIRDAAYREAREIARPVVPMHVGVDHGAVSGDFTAVAVVSTKPRIVVRDEPETVSEPEDPADDLLAMDEHEHSEQEQLQNEDLSFGGDFVPEDEMPVKPPSQFAGITVEESVPELPQPAPAPPKPLTEAQRRIAQVDSMLSKRASPAATTVTRRASLQDRARSSPRGRTVAADSAGNPIVPRQPNQQASQRPGGGVLQTGGVEMVRRESDGPKLDGGDEGGFSQG